MRLVLDISQKTKFSEAISWIKVQNISIDISLKFILKGPINNISALDHILARRRIGDEPLSEPMLTQFTDAYMRH